MPPSPNLSSSKVVKSCEDPNSKSGNNLITLTTCPPITTHSVEPKAFFDAQGDSLQQVASTGFETDDANVTEAETETIQRFVRTADGRGVAIVRRTVGEAWILENERLKRVGGWSGDEAVVILDGGYTTVTLDRQSVQLTIRHHDTGVQDVLTVPPLQSLVAFPITNSHTPLIGITKDHLIAHIHIPDSSDPSVKPELYSVNSLPLESPPRLILPVDPMAWSSHGLSIERDVLVSVSDDGVLSFWVPETESAIPTKHEKSRWRCTGSVHTERKDIRLARCSSAKKTVLGTHYPFSILIHNRLLLIVVPHPSGEEITIWDSKESQFSTGLEYRHITDHSEPIKDLDWTSTSDAESILAVGYAHHVLLLCQQRMTYFEQEVGWSVFGKVEISQCVAYFVSQTLYETHCFWIVSHPMISQIRYGYLADLCWSQLGIRCTISDRKSLQEEARS